MMNMRNLFLTALVIAALTLGAGMILAQDDGGGSDEDAPVKSREHFGFGVRGFGNHDRDFGRGAMGRGFGGRDMGQVGAQLLPLITEATGLELDALRSALRDGSSLASLIEANGGDVANFIAQATELVSAQVNANIAERIEALVNGEHPGGKEGRNLRGFGQRGMGGNVAVLTGGSDALALVMEATGLEPGELRSAMLDGGTLASLIEANDGDVATFTAQASDMANSMIDAVVAAGRLTAERAATIKAGIAERIEALVSGEHPFAKGMRTRAAAWDAAKERGSEADGEESGTRYTLDETFATVRNGVRLVMSWDAAANAFSGTVENTTTATIQAVRVEVHLSNGVELGPTTPGDLAPGETRAVQLSAAGQDFDGWSPHSETGSGEHGGNESEGRGEHGGSGDESHDSDENDAEG